MVVKQGLSHKRADYLSRLINGEAPVGIDDDLPDAYLFNVEMIPRWSEDYIPLMTIGKFDIPLPLQQKKEIILETANLKMVSRHLYKQGQDGILRLCVEPSEQSYYIEAAHVAVGGIHMAGNQMIKHVLWLGVWWPTMKSNIHLYVKQCKECQIRTLLPHATLFHVSVAPNWSKYW